MVCDLHGICKRGSGQALSSLSFYFSPLVVESAQVEFGWFCRWWASPASPGDSCLSLLSSSKLGATAGAWFCTSNGEHKALARTPLPGSHLCWPEGSVTFLFSPYPLLPHFFPLPSQSAPPCPFAHSLFASSFFYATTCSGAPLLPSLPSPPSFLLLPHCFVVPSVPPSPCQSVSQSWEGGLPRASLHGIACGPVPFCPSVVRICRDEPWDPSVGDWATRSGVSSSSPAQLSPGNKLLSCPNDKNKRNNRERARTGRPSGTK